MATREENLATVRRIRAELMALLEGMDYCLDWKEGDGWCAARSYITWWTRPRAAWGRSLPASWTAAGAEVVILPDISDITPARAAAGIAEALAGPLSALQTLEDAVSAAGDADFDARTTWARPAGARHSRVAHGAGAAGRRVRPALGGTSGAIARLAPGAGAVKPAIIAGPHFRSGAGTGLCAAPPGAGEIAGRPDRPE